MMSVNRKNQCDPRDLFEKKAREYGYRGALKRGVTTDYESIFETAMYAGFRIGYKTVKREESKS